MKKIMRILAGVASVLLLCSASCSKDETNEKNLEGKWQSTSYSWSEYEAGKLVEEGSESCIDWYVGLYFKADGTGQEIFFGEGESDTTPITWVIMGDKLMITDPDDDTVTFDIVEIKSNTMTLSLVEEYTEDGIQCRGITTYYFKKI